MSQKSRQPVKAIRHRRVPPGNLTQSAFIRPHSETLSIAAMCVCNPDRSPLEPIVETHPQLQPALGIVDRLRGDWLIQQLRSRFSLMDVLGRDEQPR